jgi:hypothetical protein
MTQPNLFGDDNRQSRSSSLTSLHEIARALGGDVSGREVLAPGPGHTAGDRSLSVILGDNGDIVVHSFAGGDPIALKDYVRSKCGMPQWKPNAGGSGINGHHAPKRGRPKVVAMYKYQQADGTPYLRVQRTETKAFWQAHWNGTGWAKGKPAGPKIPYRLPELAQRPDEPVWIVEGEGCADRLASLGILATTASEGAGKWTPDLNEHFRRRDVFVLPDNDDVGRKHARHVATNLFGIARSVTVVDLPNLPEHGDVVDWLDADGSVDELRTLSAKTPPFRVEEGERHSPDESPLPDPPRKRRLIHFRELLSLSSEPAYLIKGLVPRTGLVVVWGQRSCGKSFWLMDLLMHVALGRPYRGRKVVQGPVAYCAFEGQDGYRRRAMGFSQHHRLADDADPPFHFSGGAMLFAKDYPSLIADIKAELDPGSRPVAVVLDTLNRSIDGSESDDEVMGAYIRAADAVREAFGCVVIIVHHCGYNEKRPRGHSSLTDAADAQIAITRDGDTITAEVEKMKDGPEGETIISELLLVRIGTDPDGDPITSRVVVEGHATPVESAAATATKSEERQHSPLYMVLMDTSDGAPPVQIGGNGRLVRAVAEDVVRGAFDERCGPAKSKDARRMRWTRALKDAGDWIGSAMVDGSKMLWLEQAERTNEHRNCSRRSHAAQ